jgi:hypothetical protein
VVNPVTVGSGETKMTHAEYRNKKVTRGWRSLDLKVFIN